MQLDTKDDYEKGNFFENIEKRLEKTELMASKEHAAYRNRRVIYMLTALLVAMAMSITART